MKNPKHTPVQMNGKKKPLPDCRFCDLFASQLS